VLASSTEVATATFEEADPSREVADFGGVGDAWFSVDSGARCERSAFEVSHDSLG